MKTKQSTSNQANQPYLSPTRDPKPILVIWNQTLRNEKNLENLEKAKETIEGEINSKATTHQAYNRKDYFLQAAQQENEKWENFNSDKIFRTFLPHSKSCCVRSV